jgi:hypothetical protein
MVVDKLSRLASTPSMEENLGGGCLHWQEASQPPYWRLCGLSEALARREWGPKVVVAVHPSCPWGQHEHLAQMALYMITNHSMEKIIT